MTAGRLVLVAGPSGSGKNSVVAQLFPHPQRWFSVSVTTRSIRDGETAGVDYNFISDAEFDQLIASGGLLEWASYAGARYGTLSAPVIERLGAGIDVLAIIELDGVDQIKLRHPQAVTIFLEPPSYEVLVQRLTGRGTEDPVAVQRRLDLARAEMLRGPQVADIVIKNTVLADTVTELDRYLEQTRI